MMPNTTAQSTPAAMRTMVVESISILLCVNETSQSRLPVLNSLELGSGARAFTRRRRC
jgi:hypothetical protein